jgi:hypothetical protein
VCRGAGNSHFATLAFSNAIALISEYNGVQLPQLLIEHFDKGDEA